MSITGDPGGRAPEGRRRAGRRAGRAVRVGRDPGRAAPPRPHRRGPARGGQPALLAARGARQPGVGVHASPAVVPGRMGNAHPSISPYELYATGDGELVLAVGNERQFAALCDVLGAPGAGGRPALCRQRRRASPIGPRCAASWSTGWRAARPPEWAARLTAARVPAGVVNDLGGRSRWPQRARPRARVDVPRARTAARRRSRATRSASRARRRPTAPPRRRYPVTDSALVPRLHDGLTRDLPVGQPQHRRAPARWCRRNSGRPR